MAKMTLEALRKLRDTMKVDIRRRETEGKDIQVIVGMGTCGIAAGAKATLDVFPRALDEHNLVDTVLVRQIGCMGHCQSEPTVEVVVPGTPVVIYGKVDAQAAKEIISKHLIGRQLVENLIIDRPVVDTIASN